MRIKARRIISFFACICIIMPCIAGGYKSYAKSQSSVDVAQEYTNLEENNELAPTPSIIELVPEIYDNKLISSSKSDKELINSISNEKESRTIYKKTKVITKSASKDLFNITGDDIEELLSQGYSVEDLFAADELANKIYQDPKLLLEKKKVSGKTFSELEKDIMTEMKESTLKHLKKEYKKEYLKLEKQGYKEEAIIEILGYCMVNKVEITDSLLKEYKVDKEKVLRKNSSVVE